MQAPTPTPNPSEGEDWIRAQADAAARQAGCELFDLAVQRRGPRWSVQVTVDRPGGVSVEDCARVSRDLGERLEGRDALPHAYTLEVSSPGLTRELRGPEDYRRFAGRYAVVQTRPSWAGPSRVEGWLAGLDPGVTAALVRPAPSGEPIAVPLAAIAWTRLDLEPAAGRAAPRPSGRKR